VKYAAHLTNNVEKTTKKQQLLLPPLWPEV
jgi:hypothetical protein